MSEKFPGFCRPNSTDTPDEWYLAAAPRIGHLSEMKVILYIIYKTFGWRKWEDWISLSQFEHGQGGSDHGCGLSRAAILDGLERALEDGYIVRRFLCPHCDNEVYRTGKERKAWKNRYGAGFKDALAAPALCPHCSQPLRGQERPFYRLAFADDLIRDYDTPQDFLAKYKPRRQVEKPSYPKVENPSTHVENPSSKLENSTSPSTTIPSTIPPAGPSTTSAASKRNVASVVAVSPFIPFQDSLESASSPGESEADPQTGHAGNGVAANLKAMAEYGVIPTRAVREVAARPSMTPRLIHDWAEYGQSLGTVKDLPAWLACMLTNANKPPPYRNGNGSSGGHRRGTYRRGRQREGTWTEDELDAARKESRSMLPIYITCGCDDPDEYFDLSPAEEERRRREWAEKQTGEAAAAIRAVGGPTATDTNSCP